MAWAWDGREVHVVHRDRTFCFDCYCAHWRAGDFGEEGLGEEVERRRWWERQAVAVKERRRALDPYSLRFECAAAGGIVRDGRSSST